MQKHFDVVEKELSYETKHVSFRHRRSENGDTCGKMPRRQTKEEVIPNLIIRTKKEVTLKVAVEVFSHESLSHRKLHY